MSLYIYLASTMNSSMMCLVIHHSVLSPLLLLAQQMPTSDSILPPDSLLPPTSGTGTVYTWMVQYTRMRVARHLY